MMMMPIIWIETRMSLIFRSSNRWCRRAPQETLNSWSVSKKSFITLNRIKIRMLKPNLLFARHRTSRVRFHRLRTTNGSSSRRWQSSRPRSLDWSKYSKQPWRAATWTLLTKSSSWFGESNSSKNKVKKGPRPPTSKAKSHTWEKLKCWSLNWCKKEKWETK